MDEMQQDRKDLRTKAACNVHYFARSNVEAPVILGMYSISRSFVTRNLQHNPLCSICHLGLILLIPSFQLLCALLEFPGEDKSIRLCVCVSSVCLSGALFLPHQLLPPRLNSAEMRADIRDMCGHCPRAQSSMFYFPSVDC